MAAAIVTGTVPTVGWCADRWPTSTTISDWAAAGAADSLADDTVAIVAIAVAAASVSVLPVEGSTPVPPRQDDELVPGRQNIGLADIWEANVSLQVEGAGSDVVHPAGAAAVMDDVHCGLGQGDVDDLEGGGAGAGAGAVAVEKQPRGIVACVAGEVECRPVAAGGPKAEGVRHAHVAAGGVAAGPPCRHRSHRRRQSIFVEVIIDTATLDVGLTVSS